MVQEKDFICVTTDTVPGRSVRQVLGLVWGIGTDNFAAYDEMESTAQAKGANAVVGVRKDTFYRQHPTGPNNEHFFYGTAVILE